MAITAFVLSLALTAASKPHGVLLLGDSLMKLGVAPAIEKVLTGRQAGPIDNKARAATGLARPDFYNWPVAAAELLKTGRYDTAVILVGANDCQAIQDAKGKPRRFDSPEWRELYAARVKAMAALLCEDGRQAYWIGLPPMAKAGFDKRIKQLDSLISQTLASASTCIKYVQIQNVIGVNGRFADRLKIGPQHVRIRDHDGIHITAGGGELIAEALLKAMDAPTVASPATTW